MPKRHGHSDHHKGSGKSRQTQEEYDTVDYGVHDEREEASSSAYPYQGTYAMASEEASYSQDDPGSEPQDTQAYYDNSPSQTATIDPSLISNPGPSSAAYNLANLYPQDAFSAGPGPEPQDIRAYHDNLSNQPAAIDPSLVAAPGPSSAAYNPASLYPQDPGYDQAGQPSSSSSVTHPHICPKENCGRAYRIESQLRKHIKTHDKPLKCEADKHCKTQKAQQRDMDRHYRTAHKKYADKQGIMEEPSICELCGESFTRPDNLRKHMKKKHSS
ncbi:hypothetical protein AK830_g9162 [Neonectria ditissima]|uniref:C2H2-type domain-containing protein n=1 Tax=Neonectria ditissima TaxID=78410 RepID=A0A0P7B680_9HYPO|nr:hypothetical protein AK830_g9162 [Neonectria ditissima]